jgi:putative ABC transport system substrate-binding protein
MWEQDGALVAKVLKGAKRSDMPVEQPSKFELVINLKKAFVTMVQLMIAAATAPAQAQQTAKVYRIAIANPVVPVADINQASKGSFAIPAIFEELTLLGYVEGRNLLIERYSGEGRAGQYPDLARQIVSRNPDLIFAITNS